MQTHFSNRTLSYEEAAGLSPEAVATAVVAKLDGSEAADFGRLLAEYIALEEHGTQQAFISQLVRPALELIAGEAKAPTERCGSPAWVSWLRSIDRYRRDNGCAPGARQLAREFGLSSAGAAWTRMGILRGQGLVDWQPGMGRTLHLTPKGRALMEGALDGAA